MKNFIITEQQAQAIGNYLLKQPTGNIPCEVVIGLIQVLQNLPPMPEPKSPEPKQSVGRDAEKEN